MPVPIRFVVAMQTALNDGNSEPDCIRPTFTIQIGSDAGEKNIYFKRRCQKS